MQPVAASLKRLGQCVGPTLNIFEIEGSADTLLSVQGYHQHLADNWEKTQAMIKGKINTED